MFSEYMLACIFYAFGIVLSKQIDMSGVFFLFLLIVFTALLRSAFKKKPRWGALILGFVFLFGAFSYFYASQNPLLREFSDKYVTASGTVYSVKDTTDDGGKNRYILKLDSVSYKDKTAKFNGKILITTDETFPFGTKITATGFLKEIRSAGNEYQFDASLYYKEKGICAKLSADEVSKTGEAFSLAPEFLLGKMKYHISCVIDRHFSGTRAALFKMIIIGDKNEFPNDFRSILLKTGVYRALYSPYMHISLIMLIVSLAPFGKKRKDSLVITFILLYALFASASPTALKTGLLFGLVLLKKQTSGFANRLDIISKIVLVLLFLNPLLCFDSGFFVSVSSTVLLAVSYDAVYPNILRRFSKNKLGYSLAKLATLWFIFVIGTLPISAYFFCGTSVYATILMTLLSPVMFVMLIFSPFMLLSLGIFGASPILAPVLGKIIDFIAFLPYAVQKLPLYYVTMRVPKLWEIVCFYLLWWAFLRILCGELKSVKTAVILTTVLGIAFSQAVLYDRDSLNIYFVNVEQGDGAVLHTQKGETVLIDGGGSLEDSYNIGESIFLPYLTSHGFHKIDVAIASHCHIDHIEGIIAAAENLDINTIVLPKGELENKYSEKLCGIAEKRHINVEFLSQSDEIIFDSGLKIRFVAPILPHAKSDDPNDLSLVAHISYGEFDALFTGDSSYQEGAEYPENIELLKVPHHGSDKNTPKEFLDIVKPHYAVISVGANNSYGLPSDRVLNRLAESGATVIRTDQSGDIQFKAKKDGSVTYKTLKGE